MAQQRIKPWIVMVCALVVLALAIFTVPRLMSGGVEGTVTAVDSTGMATIKTEEGQEHQMQGPGWQVGDKVECETKGGQVTCEKS
jgi:hypothetical protein